MVINLISVIVAFHSRCLADQLLIEFVDKGILYSFVNLLLKNMEG